MNSDLSQGVEAGAPLTPQDARIGLAGDEAAAAEHRRLRALIEDIVAGVFEVAPEQLRQPTRGRARIALARQVAMYIAHVAYARSLTEVGELFDRDRTTVAHACAVVEQRREDAAFDEAVVLLELIIRAVNVPRTGTVGARAGRAPPGMATVAA